MTDAIIIAVDEALWTAPAGQPCGISIIDLTATTCRWPIGDPGAESFRYCGARAPLDRPYCANCSKIAYEPAPVRGRVEKWMFKGLKEAA